MCTQNDNFKWNIVACICDTTLVIVTHNSQFKQWEQNPRYSFICCNRYGTKQVFYNKFSQFFSKNTLILQSSILESRVCLNNVIQTLFVTYDAWQTIYVANVFKSFLFIGNSIFEHERITDTDSLILFLSWLSNPQFYMCQMRNDTQTSVIQSGVKIK